MVLKAVSRCAAVHELPVFARRHKSQFIQKYDQGRMSCQIGADSVDEADEFTPRSYSSSTSEASSISHGYMPLQSPPKCM